MTLDYERKGIYILNESALDDLVDRYLDLQLQVAQLTQENRLQAAALQCCADGQGKNHAELAQLRQQLTEKEQA